MNKAMKVASVIVSVASMVLPIATNYFDNKKLDEKIAKAVAEAVAKN